MPLDPRARLNQDRTNLARTIARVQQGQLSERLAIQQLQALPSFQSGNHEFANVIGLTPQQRDAIGALDPGAIGGIEVLRRIVEEGGGGQRGTGVNTAIFEDALPESPETVPGGIGPSGGETPTSPGGGATPFPSPPPPPGGFTPTTPTALPPPGAPTPIPVPPPGVPPTGGSRGVERPGAGIGRRRLTGLLTRQAFDAQIPGAGDRTATRPASPLNRRRESSTDPVKKRLLSELASG